MSPLQSRKSYRRQILCQGWGAEGWKLFTNSPFLLTRTVFPELDSGWDCVIALAIEDEKELIARGPILITFPTSTSDILTPHHPKPITFPSPSDISPPHDPIPCDIPHSFWYITPMWSHTPSHSPLLLIYHPYRIPYPMIFPPPSDISPPHGAIPITFPPPSNILPPRFKGVVAGKAQILND